MKLVRVLRTWSPDVVHLNTGGATGGLQVVAVARAVCSATVVITEHDVPAARPSRQQRVSRQALDALTHAVLTISSKTALARRERLPTSAADRKFGVIPIGIPIKDVPSEERRDNRVRLRAELGIHARAVVIGCTVRLVPGKGLEDLLEAFALVQHEYACELLLVGDGPLRHDLEALAERLGVRNHVHFPGFKADPRPYLDMMDVFALAVHFGSGSMALLDAMAHGLPSVITFCGPDEAVIPGETGLGAPPSNPPALASAISQLVRDAHLRAQLAAAGAAYVRRQFTIARVANDLLEIYEAAKRSGVPPHHRIAQPEETGHVWGQPVPAVQ